MWCTARVLCADRWWLRVNEKTNIIKLFLSRLQAAVCESYFSFGNELSNHQFHKTNFEKGRGAPIHKGSQNSNPRQPMQSKKGCAAPRWLSPCKCKCSNWCNCGCKRYEKTFQVFTNFVINTITIKNLNHQETFSSFESFVTASVALPQLFTVQQSTCSNRKTNEESSGVQNFARARWKELGLKGRQ